MCEQIDAVLFAENYKRRNAGVLWEHGGICLGEGGGEWLIRGGIPEGGHFLDILDLAGSRDEAWEETEVHPGERE